MPGTQPTLTSDGTIPAPFTAIAQSLQSIGALAGANATQTGHQVLDGHQNTVGIVGGLGQVVTVGAGWFLPTATTTTLSTTLTSVSRTDGIFPGMAVDGAGIPNGTTVISVGSSTIVMSQAATASALGVTITVGMTPGVPLFTGLAGQFGFAVPSAFAYSTGSITGQPIPANTTSLTVASGTGFVVGMPIGCLWYDATRPAIVEGVIPIYTTIATIVGTTITLSAAATVPSGLTYSGLYVVGATWTSLAGASVSPS